MQNEILQNFTCEQDRQYKMIDCTLGEGGHSNLMLNKYSNVFITGIDRDKNIMQKALNRNKDFGPRFRAVNHWFDEYLKDCPLCSVDYILFDLGISIFHYEESNRGFSFQRDENLDMRLNTEASLSAYDVVNSYSKEELANVIYEFGEERYSRRIADAIVTSRKIEPIKTSKELENIIYNSVPQVYKHGRIHPATRTFQAIRIEVNKELDRIGPALDAAIGCLKPGGKIAVITFHSLEDRIAKWTFKKHLAYEKPDIKLINKKPLLPTAEECRINPPSRSAKLRLVEKIEV